MRSSAQNFQTPGRFLQFFLQRHKRCLLSWHFGFLVTPPWLSWQVDSLQASNQLNQVPKRAHENIFVLIQKCFLLQKQLECLGHLAAMTLVALMTDELCATTGLNLMTPRCWSEDGRSARSTFLPLEAAQGLISNDLKQIGGQIKGTPTDFLFWTLQQASNTCLLVITQLIYVECHLWQLTIKAKMWPNYFHCLLEIELVVWSRPVAASPALQQAAWFRVDIGLDTGWYGLI